MRKNLRKAGLAPPEFDSDRTADQFTTTFYLHHFLEAEDLDWLGRFKHFNLSEAEIRGLIHAREAGRLDNETYRELNDVETLKASQDLRRLRKADLLSMEGGGTKTYYEPAEKLLGTESTTQGELSFEGDDVETIQAEHGTSDAEAESEHAGALSSQASREDLPTEIQDAISELGEKASAEALQQVILRLCQWHPLSASELSHLLQRTQRYLVHHHLKPLIEEGSLERTHPDAPRSPNQKYKTTQNT